VDELHFARGWPYRPARATRGTVVKEQLARREEALAQAPLFSGLPKRNVRELARVSRVAEYPEGAAIMTEGSIGSAFYVILDGRAKVVRGARTVTRLGPGDFFGELSLLDGAPRAASVVTETTVRCLDLAGKDFLGVLEKDAALALRILKGVAAWLREAGGPATRVDNIPRRS
jgi:CRP/FNR family transcriptional regulator, cyclic AMP receptor protein